MKQFLALTGILGGLLWVGLAFSPPEWGPPGTTDYANYELWNRLWTPALLAMLLGFSGFLLMVRSALTRIASGGFIAFLVGFALMVTGNFAEFWIFTDLPYEGEGSIIRSIAWMMFLFGTLLMLVASTVTGFAMLRTASVPRWLSLLFILLLPLTITSGFLNMSLVGLPTGGLSVIAGSSALLLSSTLSTVRSRSGAS